MSTDNWTFRKLATMVVRERVEPHGFRVVELSAEDTWDRDWDPSPKDCLARDRAREILASIPTASGVGMGHLDVQACQIDFDGQGRPLPAIFVDFGEGELCVWIVYDLEDPPRVD